MPRYVVEIQPDGRPALRLVLEDDPGQAPRPDDYVSDEFVIEPVIIDPHPAPQDERGIIIHM
jgi:hypothetical protein